MFDTGTSLQSAASSKPARSFIFCTSYINGSADCSVKRYLKWLRYYGERKACFGAGRIFIMDDGSPLDYIPRGVSIVNADEPLPATLPDGPVMFRFNRNYGRPSFSVYPGWWRSFTFAAIVAKAYSFQKAIHCESDAYVISERMMHYITARSDGWTTFWCKRWGFPESALQVIAGDALPILETFHAPGEKFWFADRGVTGFAEHILPFTHVNKAFEGDRYGEYREGYPLQADFVCQASLAMNFDHIPRNTGQCPPIPA